MFTEINNLELMSQNFIVQGYILFENNDNLAFYPVVKCNNCIVNCDYFYPLKSRNKQNKYRFQFTINLKDQKKIYSFYFIQLIDDKEIIIKINNFHYFCPISMYYSNSYFFSEKWLLNYKNNTFTIVPCTWYKHIFYEFRFCKQLAKHKHYNDILVRQICLFLKRFLKKEIWILYDRTYRADDNAEVFFEYLGSKKLTNIHLFFLLDKRSQDYKRIKKMGKVVPFFSVREKFLFLLCQYKISSHADHYTTYPMGEENHSFHDLLHNPKFIFLQHGVIKDDFSNWLNFYNRKIYGFVTSSQIEANSILTLQYEYSDNQIWVTGLPRFDKLYYQEKNLITIMPTWRKYLMEDKYNIHGIRNLKQDFEQSNFYKAYDALLSNKLLKHELAQKGYKLAIMPHPMMEPYLSRFPYYEDIYYFSSKDKYCDVFAWSNLIITDYSSAVFDFALLKKPIIYYQFDFDEFFSGAHTANQGYFDYQNMGFGEVVDNPLKVVTTLLKYIQNGCSMPICYQKRVDTFFSCTKQHNCDRLYEQIMSSKLKSTVYNTELSFINKQVNTPPLKWGLFLISLG